MKVRVQSYSRENRWEIERLSMAVYQLGISALSLCPAYQIGHYTVQVYGSSVIKSKIMD